MIIGIGCDIVEIARIKKLISKEAIIKKLFTQKEQELLHKQPQKAQWAAGRFAAKEAVAKALKVGIGKCPPACVEVLYDENGAPTAQLIGNAKKLLPKGGAIIHISISHDAGVAIAQVVIEDKGKSVQIKDMDAAKEISFLLPMRSENTHKGDMGKVAIFAGSKHYTGAGYLATLGVLRAGVGLVTWCTNYLPANSPPEAMNYVLPKINGIKKFIEFCKDKDAVVIGPGLGEKYASKAMKKAVHKINCPMVLDADALNALSMMEPLPTLGDDVVLTPHIGEAARMLNKSNDYVAQNTVECAKELAKLTGATVVLKCHNTVVCSPHMKVFINSSGNAGMATGGSGDVLSGIIGALLARLNPFDAARYAVYLHGLAGDSAKLAVGENSMTALDIVDNMAAAFKILCEIEQ